MRLEYDFSKGKRGAVDENGETLGSSPGVMHGVANSPFSKWQAGGPPSSSVPPAC